MSEEQYELPDGWEWLPLGQVAKYINGRAFKPSDWETEGLPIIRIQNLTNPDAKFNYSSKPVEDRYLVKNGDLLISWSATLDAFMWNRGPAVLNQHIFLVEENTSQIDRRYLYHVVRAQLQSLKDQVHGTGMQHITRGPFEATEIPVAPLAEQHRLVEKIERLFTESRTARETLEQVPLLLKRFRQAVLARAFRGELTERDPNDEPASVLLENIRTERRRKWEEDLRAGGKDPGKARYVEPEPPATSELPELPEGWCWASLDQMLLKIDAGHSPNAQGRPANHNEYGVLKVSAVSWGKFLPEENKALLPGTGPDLKLAVKAGDLLISRANTVNLVGAVVLVKRDYPNLLLSDKSLRLIPVIDEIPRLFLLYALRTKWVRNIFEDKATGTSNSMRNISQKTIRSAPIVLPPLGEQRRIIETIERLFAQAEAIEQGVDVARRRVEKVDQAILARAFRGQL